MVGLTTHRIRLTIYQRVVWIVLHMAPCFFFSPPPHANPHTHNRHQGEARNQYPFSYGIYFPFATRLNFTLKEPGLQRRQHLFFAI